MHSNPRSPAPENTSSSSLQLQYPAELHKFAIAKGGTPSSDPLDLVHRVRAIISARASIRDHGSDSGPTRSSNGGTSSYYGELESGETGSLHFSELSKITGLPSESSWFQYTGGEDGTARESGDESFARLREGAVRSVAGSIIHSDSQSISRQAEYSHSSILDDINIQRQTTVKRASNRSLGRISPTVPSKVGVLGIDSDSSDDDVCESDVDGGIDPEAVRRTVLCRPVLQPIQAVDPIFGVIFDSSSNGSTPDLFPRPLHVNQVGKRPADTPINSLATPPPMIGVIPPTPFLHTSSSEIEDRYKKVDAASEVVAHTGASTPREPSTVIGHTGASTPEEEADDSYRLTNRRTMTEFNYEEYAQDEYGKPGVSRENVAAQSNHSNMPNISDFSPPSGAVLNQRLPSNTVALKESLSQLPSYSGSSIDQPPIVRTGSLRDEYSRTNVQVFTNTQVEKEVDISRGRASKSRNSDDSGSRGGSHPRSRNRTPNPTPGDVPLTTESFSKIIYDLEDMLNQALELAGRAVVDSNSVLDQREASRRGSSAASACGDSMRPSTDAGLERAVTAPESHEKETPRHDESEHSFPVEEEPSIPSEVKRRVDRTSHVAVYRDDGEHTGDSTGDVLKVNEKGHVALSSVPERKVPERKKSEVRRQSSLRVANSASKDRNHSRSSYNSYPTRSSKSALEGEKFRMEIGRSGELVLVRLPPVPSSTFSSTREESNLSGRGRKRVKPGWEWGLNRKRFAAAVVLAIVGLVGYIVGNYFAEYPTIQEHLKIGPSVASFGNSMLLLGIALPTLVLWPLPLLHGRKPYLLFSVALLLPLQLPQALSLAPFTSAARNEGNSMHPYVVVFLFFRVMSGVVLGLAFMNTLSTLTDLFGPDTGACCRGGVVFNNEAPIDGHNQFHRVPGGEAGVRMGVWLGLFSWMFVASPGIGFLFGKITTAYTTPAWGFWIVAILGTVLLALIIMVPEVRPPWSKVHVVRRKSRDGRRKKSIEVIERGELKMVMFGRSSRWWWEEVWAGLRFTGQMVKQIGFLVLAIYVGWVFGQVAMVMSLLVSLIATEYKFQPTNIGLAVFALPIASSLAVPMQLMRFYLTNFRHRSAVAARNGPYGHRLEGQHPYRGALFFGCFMLPLCSFALTIAATGPPVHFIVPILFAALVSFSGTLVIAECHLILLDNWDVSDLPEPMYLSNAGSTHHGSGLGGLPHGTQRPASLHSGESAEDFTTCHPAVSSGIAIFHGLSFLFGAIAVGCSVYIVNGIGVRSGLGVYTGFTVLVTLALVAVLWRYKEVKVMEVFDNSIRDNEQQASHEKERTRTVKVSVLQRGKLTRWSEVNAMEYWGGRSGV